MANIPGIRLVSIEDTQLMDLANSAVKVVEANAALWTRPPALGFDKMAGGHDFLTKVVDPICEAEGSRGLQALLESDETGALAAFVKANRGVNAEGALKEYLSLWRRQEEAVREFERAATKPAADFSTDDAKDISKALVKAVDDAKGEGIVPTSVVRSTFINAPDRITAGMEKRLAQVDNEDPAIAAQRKAQQDAQAQFQARRAPLRYVDAKDEKDPDLKEIQEALQERWGGFDETRWNVSRNFLRNYNKDLEETDEGFTLSMQGTSKFGATRARTFTYSTEDESITGTEKGFSRQDADSIIALAALRGWKTVELQGDEKQMKKLYLAAMRQGIETVGYTPKNQRILHEGRIEHEKWQKRECRSCTDRPDQPAA